MRLAVILCTLFITAAAMAEEAVAPSTEGIPPPPMSAPAQANEAAPPLENGEALEGVEPQVTIVRRGEERIEEFRIAGRLYMIKVSPAKGFPYYLIDNDGDGSMETRQNELSNPVVPQWVLFRW